MIAIEEDFAINEEIALDFKAKMSCREVLISADDRKDYPIVYDNGKDGKILYEYGLQVNPNKTS